MRSGPKKATSLGGGVQGSCGHPSGCLDRQSGRRPLRCHHRLNHSELLRRPQLLATFVIGLRESLRGRPDRGHRGCIPAPARQNECAASRLDGDRTGCRLLRAHGGRPAGLLGQPAAGSAGDRPEAIVAAVAVAMVSYMVLWMRRNSRSLRHDLEAAAVWRCSKLARPRP